MRKAMIENGKYGKVLINTNYDLVIVHRNIDDAIIISVYNNLADFNSEWLDDDRCISIGDEFVCGAYKGYAYFGFETVEDFCISIPELDNIIKLGQYI